MVLHVVREASAAGTSFHKELGCGAWWVRQFEGPE